MFSYLQFEVWTNCDRDANTAFVQQHLADCSDTSINQPHPVNINVPQAKVKRSDNSK